jgi:hypothetical protein
MGSVHRFPEAFRKAFCSFHAAFTHYMKQQGLGKSVKILKHLARGKIKLVNEK